MRFDFPIHREQGLHPVPVPEEQTVGGKEMLQLDRLYQSGMILQREKPALFRGEADPHIPIRVESSVGVSAETVADVDGYWNATLPPMEAVPSCTVTITAGEEQIKLEDVVVGEIWIAAGQSNMEFWMRYEKHRAQETGNHPNLRFFDVPKLSYPGQEHDFDYTQVGCWRKAVPEDLDYFSAVGYFFQKELSQALDVPVGIIGCNWGGTPSCAWMRRETAERVGSVWCQTSDAVFRGIDREAYCRAMAQKPDNNTGEPFRNAFNEFILPQTPTAEEIQAFLNAQPQIPPEIAALPLPQNTPGILWQRMVETIVPFPVRGVLWYQGESDDNGDETGLYQRMLTALVQDWRQAWGETLPFLVVQLPGWKAWLDYTNMGFHRIRACQEKACREGEKMYLCSISDAGEALDIHPKDKKVVGERLAMLALGHVYGRDILCDPPMPRALSRQENTIRIAFDHAGSGMEIRGETLSALEIQGPEGSVPYTAHTEGDTLLLTIPEDCGTLRLAFAWRPWYQVNLYNSAGLPAIPFVRTLQPAFQ